MTPRKIFKKWSIRVASKIFTSIGKMGTKKTAFGTVDFKNILSGNSDPRSENHFLLYRCHHIAFYRPWSSWLVPGKMKQKSLHDYQHTSSRKHPKQREYGPYLVSAFHIPGRTEFIPGTIATSKFGNVAFSHPDSAMQEGTTEETWC